MAPENDLNEEVDMIVEDADVITVPIDDTLSNSGEAADAKAVGDALALKADKSELAAAITVNGQAADAQGKILVDGTDIPMSGTDQTTLKAAIDAVNGKTAADIKMSSAAGAKTIAEEMSDSESRTAEAIMMAPGSTVSVAQKIGAIKAVSDSNSNAIANLQAKTGDSIPISSEDSTPISQAVAARVKTVNGSAPDPDGNVDVDHALTADNLTSNASQNSTGSFVRRTSGGSASISTGDAWMSQIRGNRTHVGYSPEVLNMTVTAAPREEGETPITATIDRDVFVAYVQESGTYTMTYTTGWDTDPDLYGVTVEGDPVSGDVITIQYTMENRGTIIQSDPQSFISTGWNLYNNDVGYAIGLKYAETAMFRIDGTYTAVKFSSTIDGTKTTITPVDGLFTISASGYIWVEGGNDTDTMVFMTWSDWVEPEDAPAFEAYTADEIDLSGLMEDHFPHGLLRVADVRDEINFNTGIATSNVQRLAYSIENLETAEASGLAYEYDTNYIYLERATPVEYDMDDYDLNGMYSVNDHGLEYFIGSNIAVYAIIIYGNNLKNKLERDVLTKSQDLVNDLTTNDSTKALSAAMGYELSGNITSLTTTVNGKQNAISVSSTTATYLQLYKYGRIVFCVLSVSANKSSSSTTWGNLTSLPTGYRPIVDIHVVAIDNLASSQALELRVKTNGDIDVYYPKASTNYRPYTAFAFVSSN